MEEEVEYKVNDIVWYKSHGFYIITNEEAGLWTSCKSLEFGSKGVIKRGDKNAMLISRSNK